VDLYGEGFNGEDFNGEDPEALTERGNAEDNATLGEGKH
jgi:hypothetical protein